MAKCHKCGKGGFFQKLNSFGLCANCERLSELERQEATLKDSIQILELELHDKEALRSSISEEVRTQTLKEMSDEIDKKNAVLQDIFRHTKEREANLEELESKINTVEKNLATTTNRINKAKSVFQSIQHAIKKYDENPEISSLDLNARLESDILTVLSPTVELKLHCLDVRELRKRFRQNEKQIEVTLSKYQGRYTTKANMTIYQLMVIALKAELQNILYSIRYGKLETAEGNVKEVTEKYLSIAVDGNQNIAPTMKKFIGEIEYLFLEAVKIEYEYFVQKERIKEEQRALREQMRQEAEERKILEQQRKQIEKEESKYKLEISTISEQIALTEDDAKIKILQARIDELNAQLSVVETKKEDIVKLQHGKAGYVYIISNLGSFGEDVFKVGMTRRLEPQDRVNELSNASVPFPFDVHSFIFSDDAVDLENQMHKTLNNKRVNRVNLRKEFFRVTLDELEELTYSLDPTAEFSRTLMAEQYRQSMSVDEVPEDYDGTEDYDDEDDSEIA